VVTYVDSSVALAHLFRERRAPLPSFWGPSLVSSKLLEYEIWNRIYAYDRAGSHGSLVRDLLSGIELLELAQAVLARALQPFPVPVRTLDGLHLATIEFIRRNGDQVELASYDNRMLAAAGALGIPVLPV
jgi:hypothetical protein